MQIGDLAQATGISRDTLRYYEKRGLLQARRSDNGYRDYPQEAADWLRYIRTAQALGFTLQEIEAGGRWRSGQHGSGPARRVAGQTGRNRPPHRRLASPARRAGAAPWRAAGRVPAADGGARLSAAMPSATFRWAAHGIQAR